MRSPCVYSVKHPVRGVLVCQVGCCVGTIPDMSEQKIVYASVDLELTGFDPTTDEIVEIGIVLFELRQGVVVILEEWQSLVKPKGNLHTRIQGLTGITEQDLESAPTKDLVFSKVTELLKNTILVGHGVSLDRRFLEAFGVAQGPHTVDTLELAQIFLPTYHSYNLENLSHALGVAHATAHRALSDAQATIGVLRALISIFWSLPEAVRLRVLRVAELKGFAWAILFRNGVGEQKANFTAVAETEVGQIELTEEPLPSLEYVSTLVSTGSAYGVPWNALAESAESWVVVLSSREQVLEAARKGYATPFLGVAEAVSEEAVGRAEDTVEGLSEREVLALLKILVWQARPTTSMPLLAEINWSLLGTDFKKHFSEVRPFPQMSGVIAVDYRSLGSIPAGRSVWVCEADKYLEWLEQQSGQILSWQGVIHQFRQIYNPENGFGDASKALELQEAIAATDVFFASTLLLLKKHQGTVQGVVAQADIPPFALSRLVQAGKNYRERLGRLSGLLTDKIFLKVVRSIEWFFDTDAPADELRWIEIADGRCVFVSRPLDVEAIQQTLLGRSRRIVYATDVQGHACLDYLAQRVRMGSTKTVVQYTRQIDDALLPNIVTYASEPERDAAALQQVSASVACLVFPNQQVLKAYYDGQYANFPRTRAVVAVGVHGGVGKVLRNFRFSAKSIVFVTQQALAGFSATRLEVQRLIYMGLPVIDTTHPFVSAILHKYFKNETAGQLVFQAISFVQSLRPFSPLASREVIIAVLAEERAVGDEVLRVSFEVHP